MAKLTVLSTGSKNVEYRAEANPNGDAYNVYRDGEYVGHFGDYVAAAPSGSPIPVTSAEEGLKVFAGLEESYIHRQSL